MQLEGLKPPTLAELDQISPDRPLVVLTQLMHDAYVNSAALEAAGIDRDTPDPPGARFVRDAEGELTGMVHEVAALDRILSAMPPVPAAVNELMLNLQYAKYARAGFTTIGVLGPVGRAKDPLALFRNLARSPQVPVRAVVYALPQQLINQGAQRAQSPRFRLRGVKYWMDGSPFTGGAALAEPYTRSPLVTEELRLPVGHRGELHHDAAQFEKDFERHHVAGDQIAVHVQGERAVKVVLDAAQSVLNRHPRPDHRHRLEHNALITEAQILRAQELGITLSFFVDHIHFYGHRLRSLFGPERTGRYMPLAAARAAGHRATIHSDNPATPINPFRAIRTAVTRRTQRNLEPIAPDQAVSIEEALAALTIDAAWQFGMEAEIGSLEAGKAADLTALSANPLSTAAEELTDIRVLGTWIDGVPVNTERWTMRNAKLALRAALELAKSWFE